LRHGMRGRGLAADFSASIRQMKRRHIFMTKHHLSRPDESSKIAARTTGRHPSMRAIWRCIRSQEDCAELFTVAHSHATFRRP
ncbi:hypothetical protein ABTK41_19965, partial [Acinetobacter baumannii]